MLLTPSNRSNSLFVLPAISLIAVLAWMPVSEVAAASAIATFNELFGKEVKRVKGTPEAADDIALADQLVTAAKASDDRADLQTVLLEQAYNLASGTPAGYDTAEGAMRLLASKVPAKKKVAEAKVVALYQRGYERSTGEQKKEAGEQYLSFLLGEADAKLKAKDYAAAMLLFQKARPISFSIRSDRKDEVMAKIEYYSILAKSQQRIELYEKRIKANPWEKSSNANLFDLYLVDMDDPESAAKFTKIIADANKTKLITLANKPLEALTDKDALALGNWYEELASGAIPPAKALMLSRAKGYTALFLDKHETEDVQKTSATLALKRIDEALSKAALPPASGEAYIAEPGGTAGKSIDVLAKVDANRDKVSGDWTREGKTIKVKRSEGSRRFGDLARRFGGGNRGDRFGRGNSLAELRLPYEIKGDFSIQVKFVREDGDGTVAVAIPVGSSGVRFALDFAGDGKSGLADIKGQDARKNESTINLGLTNRRVYTLDINVTTKDKDGDQQAKIIGKLDGRTIIKWEGKSSDLDRDDTKFDGNQIGLTIYNSSVAFGSIKLRPLNGGEATGLDGEAVKAPNLADVNSEQDLEKIIRDRLKGLGTE